MPILPVMLPALLTIAVLTVRMPNAPPEMVPLLLLVTSTVLASMPNCPPVMLPVLAVTLALVVATMPEPFVPPEMLPAFAIRSTALARMPMPSALVPEMMPPAALLTVAVLPALMPNAPPEIVPELTMSARPLALTPKPPASRPTIRPAFLMVTSALATMPLAPVMVPLLAVRLTLPSSDSTAVPPAEMVPKFATVATAKLPLTRMPWVPPPLVVILPELLTVAPAATMTSPPGPDEISPKLSTVAVVTALMAFTSARMLPVARFFTVVAAPELMAVAPEMVPLLAGTSTPTRPMMPNPLVPPKMLPALSMVAVPLARIASPVALVARIVPALSTVASILAEIAVMPEILPAPALFTMTLVSPPPPTMANPLSDEMVPEFTTLR